MKRDLSKDTAPKGKTEEDPMSIEVQKVMDEAREKKIRLTGLTHSHCINCGRLPITHFTIHYPKRDKRNKHKEEKEGKWKPRKECNRCVNAKKKASGSYQKSMKNRRERYKTEDTLKESLKKAQAKARRILSDSYIRRLLKALGYTNEQITKPIIKKKRDEIKKKREDAKNKAWKTKRKTGFYEKKARKTLSDGYIRGLIRWSKGYDGRPITKKMIREKRAQIKFTRKTGEKPWIKRTDPAVKKSRKNQKIKDLSDSYIRQRIRRSKDYDGQPITNKMISDKREEILTYRDRKEKGIKAARPGIKMTDGYLRKLVASELKIPKYKVTWEQIIEKRNSLEEKRKKKDEKRIFNLLSKGTLILNDKLMLELSQPYRES